MWLFQCHLQHGLLPGLHRVPCAFWTGARTARRVRFSLAVPHCGQESENPHALQVSMSFVATQSIAGHFPGQHLDIP